MPANPLTLYAVLTIPKETQFSEENRIDETLAGFRSFTTTLVPARTLGEVEAIAEAWVNADGNIRTIVYELGNPVAMKRPSMSSVDFPELKILNRDGSYA
jgi:hypothetical protein